MDPPLRSLSTSEFKEAYALGEIDTRTVPPKPDDFDDEDYLPAPLPRHHKKRLQTLWYNRLSKIVKPELDKIVKAAAIIFNVPYVLVNIIDDDHLHPYSTVNYPEGDVDRDSSLCGHVILDPNTPLVIPDTDADWRFRNGIYTKSDYKIKFYAGSPVTGLSTPKNKNDE